jgi:hypothetical protein
MTAVLLGQGSYKRTQGRLPESVLTNMYAERAPTEASGVALLSFPGLARHVEGLDGAFRGLYQQAGTFSGDLLAVAGEKAYRIAGALETELGAIPGDERVWIAANGVRAYITTGPGAYSTDGTTVSTLVTPDSLGFSSVGYINGYFLFGQTGTSRFYWLEPGETVIDNLNFANAERGPDAILAVVILGDEIWLFGEDTTEVWIPTGDNDAPFQRVGGRLYERGCRARDTIAKMDNTIVWVGDDGIVYRADSAPVRMSEHSIEERIALGSDLEAWPFALDGHAFYALTIGGEGTFTLDVATGQWPERQSYGDTTWRARVGVNVGAQIYAGDAIEGTLWTFDRYAFEDDEGPMIRTATGTLMVSGVRAPCHSFSVDCSTGSTDDPAAVPVAVLSISDDGGNTWGDMGQAGLGRLGGYDTRLRWTRLGMMKPPGRIFKLTVSDAVSWRVSQASVGDAF